MNYYISGFPCSDELYHHGILGQKWGVRRYQKLDGTLTQAGKNRYYGISESTDTGGSGGTSRAHYRVSGSSENSIGSRIKNAVDAQMEKRREKIVRSRPWLMTDEELKTHLNRINMEKSYVNALDEVNQHSRSKRFKRLIDDIIADGAKTAVNTAIEVATNRVIAKDELKTELKRSKKISKQYAKNKVKQDILVDKALRKYDSKLASTQLLKDLERNWKSKSKDDVNDAKERWKMLREMENRYRGSNLQSYSSNGGGGKGKGNNNQQPGKKNN